METKKDKMEMSKETQKWSEGEQQEEDPVEFKEELTLG